MRLSVLRDRIHNHKYWIAVITSTIVLCSTAPASAATISLVPSSTDVTTGETFTVDFFANDVTSLNEFRFGFLFDESILTLDSISAGTFLSQGGTTMFQEGFFDIQDPTDTIVAVLFNDGWLLDPLAGVSGSGLLMSVTFTAAAIGISDISALFDLTLADGLFGADGTDMTPFGEDGLYVSSTSVNVSAPPTTVPEPGTLLLLSSGLGASVLASRRRQRRGF